MKWPLSSTAQDIITVYRPVALPYQPYNLTENHSYKKLVEQTSELPSSPQLSHLLHSRDSIVGDNSIMLSKLLEWLAGKPIAECGDLLGKQLLQWLKACCTPLIPVKTGHKEGVVPPPRRKCSQNLSILKRCDPVRLEILWGCNLMGSVTCYLSICLLLTMGSTSSNLLTTCSKL
jgi:hypothetical protein